MQKIIIKFVIILFDLMSLLLIGGNSNIEYYHLYFVNILEIIPNQRPEQKAVLIMICQCVSKLSSFGLRSQILIYGCRIYIMSQKDYDA